MIKIIQLLFTALFLTSCTGPVKSKLENVHEYTDTVKLQPPNNTPTDTVEHITVNNHYLIKANPGPTPHQVVAFAKTLIGIPYKYASTDPSEGFDCSGFITYVFNHFDIIVPRSSVDFTNVGEEVNRNNAKEGDLILFTGTIDSIRTVGHMGIVTENTDTLKFIHSTSGHANGVTISTLNEYYEKRFVKVIRIFESKGKSDPL